MKFGSVGAVIAAASKKDAVPLLKVGSIPIVRRIVLTVFPIVVVTGTEELEVTHQVAPWAWCSSKIRSARNRSFSPP